MTSDGPPSPAAPSICIVLALEARPVVTIDAVNEHEAQALGDWICSHDDYVELINEAHRLGEEQAA